MQLLQVAPRIGQRLWYNLIALAVLLASCHAPQVLTAKDQYSPDAGTPGQGQVQTIDSSQPWAKLATLTNALEESTMETMQATEPKLRTDDSLDGVAYRLSFDTVSEEWLLVRLPFTDFVPTFRGRIPVYHPQLDADQILWLDDHRQAGRSLQPGNGMDQSLFLSW